MATGTRLHRKSMAARQVAADLRKDYAPADKAVEHAPEIKRQRKVAVYKPRKDKV